MSIILKLFKHILVKIYLEFGEFILKSAEKIKKGKNITMKKV